MKHFTLDLSSATEPLYKNWEFCIGSCHASTALRADWQQQLTRCQREIGYRYIRFHGLFDDDMSVVRKPVFGSELLLSFVNIDKIFDFLLSINMKPFVEIGFMPECLASGTKTIFHYKGNTTPPRDYSQWSWLIDEFTKHLIQRYGRAEVRQWFFEIWNEPNLGGPDSPYGFWSADMQEYFRLYKVTVEAIKGVDPFLKVGGPATSNNAWIPEMLEFCRESHTPIDFISTHHYPTDIVLGYGVEDSANFSNPLKDLSKAVKRMSDPETSEDFKKEYAVFQSHLWEHVDRGVLTEMTKRAVADAKGLPVYYTEWGSLAGLPSDGPFGASFISKTVLDGHGLAAGYSFWTFSDIFEENGQESHAFFGGFGLMTQHGIPKAPYRAFELLHELGNEIYKKMADGTVDVYAVKKSVAGALQFMLVNHHSLLHPIETESIRLDLKHSGSCISAEIKRIDEKHANALAAWQQMGSIEYLSKGQAAALYAASEITTEHLEYYQEEEDITLDIELPPMGIALVTLYFNK
ncbi:MAG: hypothetical protein K0R21_566 [Anaerocolumna sp.]|jgi:xylan 1,4-beta-xylosidase|nr:hypothetical protein [Anaerocolumna sp.]